MVENHFLSVVVSIWSALSTNPSWCVGHRRVCVISRIVSENLQGNCSNSFAAPNAPVQNFQRFCRWGLSGSVTGGICHFLYPGRVVPCCSYTSQSTCISKYHIMRYARECIYKYIYIYTYITYVDAHRLDQLTSFLNRSTGGSFFRAWYIYIHISVSISVSLYPCICKPAVVHSDLSLIDPKRLPMSQGTHLLSWSHREWTLNPCNAWLMWYERYSGLICYIDYVMQYIYICTHCTIDWHMYIIGTQTYTIL